MYDHIVCLCVWCSKNCFSTSKKCNINFVCTKLTKFVISDEQIEQNDIRGRRPEGRRIVRTEGRNVERRNVERRPARSQRQRVRQEDVRRQAEETSDARGRRKEGIGHRPRHWASVGLDPNEKLSNNSTNSHQVRNIWFTFISSIGGFKLFKRFNRKSQRSYKEF